MTVPTTTAFSGPYYANGATVNFPFGFKVNSTDEVAAFYLEDDGSETVIPSADYTVSLSVNENSPGGTLTFTAPPAADPRPIYLALDPDFTQQTKFEDEGAFNQSILNPTFDAGALRSIWLRARVDRAIVAPFGESGFGFPTAASRANKFPAFGPLGELIMSQGTGSDPALRGDLGGDGGDGEGADLVMTPYGTMWNIIRRGIPRTPLDFGAVGNGLVDDTTALAAWAASGEKLAMPAGEYSFMSDAPIELNLVGTVIDATGSRSNIALGQRNAGRGLVEPRAADCVIRGLRLHNPDLLSAVSGSQNHAVLCRANGTRLEGLRVQDFEMGLTTTAGANPAGAAVEGEIFDTWYLYNIVRILGVGAGTPDDGLGKGEDRGDGITHWGGRGFAIGNYVVARDNTDARGFIFFEGLDAFALDTTGYDNKSVGFISQNYCGRAAGIANGGGRARRGIDVEDYQRCTVSANVVASVAWFGIQLAGNCSYSRALGNFVLMDCPDTNANGASWSPNRAAYHYYPNGTPGKEVLFDGNSSYHTTALARGVMLNGTANSAPKGVVVRNHRVIAEPGLDMGTRDGIVVSDFTAGAEITLDNVEVVGKFNFGIYAVSVPTLRINGKSRIEGTDNFGATLQNIGALSIDGLEIVGAAHGIEFVNVTGTVADLVLDTAAGLWIATAGTNALAFENSRARGGSGLLSNFGTNTISIWRGMGDGWAYLSGTAAYDPANVVAGTNGGASGNISVPGAQVGDSVRAKYSLPTGGLVPVAVVSPADTVIAGFANITGGDLDLGAGTMTVKVERG